MRFSFRKRAPAPAPAPRGPERPAGTQNRISRDRPPGLQRTSAEDLARELLHRIREGELTTHDALLRYGNELEFELARRLDVIPNRFGTTRLLYLFANFHADVARFSPPLEGATYVELGAGSQHPFGLLFLLLALGAKRGVAVDLDEQQDESVAARALATCASLLLLDPPCLVGTHPVTAERVLQNLSSFDLGLLRTGDPEGIDRKRLVYLRESVARTSLADGEADVVLTNAFLEHLPRVDEAVAEMARITRKGGLGLHNLDAVDHRSYEQKDLHPLAFLRIENQAELDAIVPWCNRLRPAQFVEIFERHGFEVLEVHPYAKVPVSTESRSRFAEPFRSMALDALEVTQARLCVRRR